MLFNRLFPFCLIKRIHTTAMANSKFEYVKSFETEDTLLRNCWIVVRVDGKGFHKFSKVHEFDKPNDARALRLMNKAATVVMQEYKDIVIAYGHSDEYSFVLRKEAMIYNRRKDKIMTYLNSLFTSAYVYFWKDYFPSLKMKYPPAFDSRVVLYPCDEDLRNYLSWRQADCHINNLYNTAFWALVLKGGSTNSEAEKTLSGTVSSEKHEILFTQFDINYNNEPVLYKKGTILLRKTIPHPVHGKRRQVIFPFHEDLIQQSFWQTHTNILIGEVSQVYAYPHKEKLPNLVLQQLHLCDKIEEENQ
uniref:tRNA(His) guanylyltransferase n=1 Tax=Diabrotica virgifera virgifera TaxID=50390 RepID=A0A6P7GUR3_DIAVI